MATRQVKSLTVDSPQVNKRTQEPFPQQNDFSPGLPYRLLFLVTVLKMVLNNGEHGWCKQAGTPGGAGIVSNRECRVKAVGQVE